jgi:hypothetical protein
MNVEQLYLCFLILTIKGDMMNFVKTDKKTKKCIISSSKARMLLQRMIIHESNVFTVKN